MGNSQSPASRFMGCLLGGAIGDALGAPAEGIRSLQGIYDKFGREGMSRLHPYGGYHDEAIKHNGIGAITDDTTMHAATIGAMMLGMRQPSRLVQYAWRGYIRWAAEQGDGLKVMPHIDLSADWPRELQPFWFACGAGRGTIAALATGKCGSVDLPLKYDAVIRGQQVIGPNEGCGGMMRAAALAFWPHEADKFRLGVENAAITHGAPTAYLATGAITELTHGALQGLSMPDAFNAMMRRLEREPDHEAVKLAAHTGWSEAHRDISFEAIDALPTKLGYKNPFLAAPVLAQTAFALSAHTHRKLAFKDTLTLAATHSGDSDSVAAIVGNILGTAQGERAIPQDWLLHIQKRYDLEALGRAAILRLSL